MSSTDRFPCFVDCSDNRVYPIRGRVVTVGSSPECHVSIGKPSVAPRAAHLLFSEGAYRLQALDEKGGVKVNDKPCPDSHHLSHGETVTIGPLRLRYLEHDESTEDGRPGSGPVSPMRGLIDAVVGLLRQSDREVYGDLVGAVSRLLVCDAARLIGVDAQSGDHVTLARYPESAGLERYSQRALRWAEESGATVLMHDIDWRKTDEPTTSLERNAVGSVLCAPLREEGETIGYLYLDRLSDAVSFQERDREFFDALLPLFSEILSNDKQRRRQRETIARLQDSRSPSRGSIVHESRIMRETIEYAEKVAKTDSPVLVLGETGTGKELLVRFIHDHSSRASEPYRAINCGAIPENLIESELFGHEKGSFTGATSRKIGVFESVAGGTLFLDEIGELPLMLQVKLLRVLQEEEIVRIGGAETIPVRARIIAATNKDLEKEVREGAFRRDLYFRLNVLSVRLPPLARRDRDVLLLAEYFICRYAQQFGMAGKTLSPSARKALLAYRWPGNVRELENVVQKAMVLSGERTIAGTALDLDGETLFTDEERREGGETLKEIRARAEREAIRSALRKSQGNVSLSAKLLDVDRKWLMKLMKEHGIDPDDYRA